MVEHVGQHGTVGVVGTGHHHHVHQARRQQVAVVGKGGDSSAVVASGSHDPLALCGDRVGGGSDHSAGHRLQVPQVLGAHHPGTDDPVPHLIGGHGVPLGVGQSDMRTDGQVGGRVDVVGHDPAWWTPLV